jgi:serine/threonine protein kinase
MNISALPGASGEGDVLQVLWENAERVFCKLTCDSAEGIRYAFIPVAGGLEHPTPESVDRLAHEYGLREHLDGEWALRPLKLVREPGRTMLIVDYRGGEPLERHIRQPFEIEKFLRFALALSGALSRFHGRGLIHKDIKPANVLIEPATGQVWLTGFGIASRLPRERQAPEPPEFIAGTLAYMAPDG